MSHAKLIFLIALVVFFIVLFVVAYVWMRRPDFGQKGGRPIPTALGGTVPTVSRGEPSGSRPDGDVALMDAARVHEGP